LNRIDLKVLVSSHDDSQTEQKAYASSTVKQQIRLAREIQQQRYSGAKFGECNADVPNEAEFQRFAPALEAHVRQYIDDLLLRLDLTKRMQVKLLLVARTVADYEEVRAVRVRDVEEAVDLMGLEHEYFKGIMS
jgi:predicted ATPase with chaperone activity